MTEVKLTKPIKAHGRELESLTFREPNGEDIVTCGYPLKIGEGAATPEAGAVARYIARLADVPPSSVKQLTAADFNSCMAAVVGFFGSTAEESTS